MTNQDQKADGDGVAPTTGLEALQAQLAEAQAKAAENWDRALRATAELENVRRRVERDAAVQRKYALEGILTDLIQVTESLELALKAIEAAPAEARTHLEGVQLTYKQYWSVLERHGVSEVDPQGKPFDPELHQAVTMQESTTLPPNQVITVMQKGYRLHDRLLRPAMVVVSRAPVADAADAPGAAPPGATGG